ncbi:MAG TPA: aspartate dehydrogenase [Porticoccaceae bacterium]|nr:aspartate dehydrogenase [Porticoccaceae bacterium]
MVRIGLLGCGNIGKLIAAKSGSCCEIVAAYDRHDDRRKAIAEGTGAIACENFSEMFKLDFDVLVEAASISGAQAYAKDALSSGKDLVLLSVGALADPTFRVGLLKAAEEGDALLRIPSGAIMGLDNLKIGSISKLRRLLLRTTKPASVLGCDVAEKQCVYRGPTAEAIKRYPRNINVAVSIALAAETEVEVEIWADPAADSNTHEIFAEGEFGHALMRVENIPCPDNPHTSYLAVLSVLALLQNYNKRLRVGT